MRRMRNIVYLFLLLMIQVSILCCKDTADDGARGTLVASNDIVALYARNRGKFYIFHYSSYGENRPTLILYPEDFFVYSLDVIKTEIDTPFPTHFTFVQVGVMPSNNTRVFLGVVRVTREIDKPYTIDVRKICIWDGVYQEYINIKVDSRGEYAYVFADSFTLSFDIVRNSIVKRIETASLAWERQYLPRSFDLTEVAAVVVGLGRFGPYFYPVVYLVQLQSLTTLYSLSSSDRDEIAFEGMYTDTYDHANDMSVSISTNGDRAIVGIPRYDRVFLVTINTNSNDPTNWRLNIVNETIWPVSGIGFGRSVAWIDDKTIIVTVLTLPNRYWSQSELWIFNVDETLEKPLFVFPNNQQSLRLKRRPFFLQIISSKHFLYIVTDQRSLIIYPASSLGFTASWSDASSTIFYIVLKPRICVAGTYKNTLGFGPCTICPPQTKNPADDQLILRDECKPCARTSFCPLGSTDDLSLDTLPSYTQSFSYPDTPDINNYDDLLFQNMFSIPPLGHCIIFSPMFWGLLAIGLCFFIWFLMAILNLCRFHATNPCRSRTKLIFKQLDIIHGGEKWIGGLFSFAALVFIIFGIWFASVYIGVYPVEKFSSSSSSSCRADMFNTQFSNALQLPLPSSSGEYWPVFDMLNKQPLTMTVDFINTRANCNDITVQQNRPSVKYLLLSVKNCTHYYSNNATLSITFSLPPHPATVQFNISGQYFVGAVRLCLRGPRLVREVNTLHQLDTCQLYYTDNETLGHDVTVPIVLIKTINETKPLHAGDETLYDGRWTPTWTTPSGLSDKLVYEQMGDYLHYAWHQNYLTITLTEQSFFVQNSQQPIIRKAELVFHTLLFTSLVIELFGFAFLITKIVILPCIGPVLRRLHLQPSVTSREDLVSAITPRTTRSASLPNSIASPEGYRSHTTTKLTDLYKRRKAKFQFRQPRPRVAFDLYLL